MDLLLYVLDYPGINKVLDIELELIKGVYGVKYKVCIMFSVFIPYLR